MIVLDTNVVSEMMRAEPDPRVTTWLVRQRPRDRFITSVTVAEIGYGIARLPDGRRRDALGAEASRAFAQFAEATLPFGGDAAALYGDIVTERQRAGTPISTFDALLAAIVRSHRAPLATRNTSDFAGLGLDLVNPWDAPTP